LFGKLPTRGDFVTRGLPASFVEPWACWVDRAMIGSRALLGDAWLEAWMRAPVWRFALPAGACGPHPALGLMLPSIDRVGRGYPLMVAILFPAHHAAPDPEAGTPFLDAVEDAARAALTDDLDPDALAERIATAPSPVEPGSGAGQGAHWWTDGAPAVASAALVLDGLPPMPDHAAMLAGESGQDDPRDTPLGGAWP